MSPKRKAPPAPAEEAAGRILVVARSEDIVSRLQQVLDGDPVAVDREPTIGRVVERFDTRSYDVVLVTSSVIRAGGIDEVDLLEVITAKSPATQVLFLLEPRDLGAAMPTLKAGGYRYAKRPVGDAELRLLVRTALEESRQHPTYQQTPVTPAADRFEQMVGRSETMQAAYRLIRQAASTDMPVLLTGETGTGKDLAAMAIHNQSDRADGPFIPVNLGALPGELVASELFGHEKGAFTGALERRRGTFEEAREGTVFLDEISTIDERVQVSLLRLIEESKFQRLGGRRTIVNTARLIAATNEDLAEAVQRGRFREDLYYRLDVFRIDLPSLRNRRGDIPLLIDEFLKRYNASFQKRIVGIAPECVSLLEAHDWPGNVRELKNVIQRAVLICPGDVLLVEHLPPRLRPDRKPTPKVSFEVGTSLEDVEREMIVRTLAVADNNRKRAADLLGISRRSLYNKLRKHAID